jgi:hypothetical protein
MAQQPLTLVLKGIQKKGFGLGFSNCAVRSDILKWTGLKDALGHQDTIFAFEAIKQGYTVKTDLDNLAIHDHPFRSRKGSFFRSAGFTKNHVLVYRIVFGGFIFPKDRNARKVSLGSAIGIAMEISAIAGVRAWKEWNERIDTPLLRYLFDRIVGLLSGMIAGMILGIGTRKASIKAIGNLHNQRRRR